MEELTTMVQAGQRPHVVCVPLPLQSHITSMLMLAKLLHNRGFCITFVNTEYNHRRRLNAGGAAALDGLPDFRFATIPDGLPESEGNTTQDPASLLESTSKNCLEPFCDLLTELQSSTTGNVPPLNSIISDYNMSFALTAAERFGLPGVSYFPPSACGTLGITQFKNLIEKGYFPLKDMTQLTNGYMETTLDWIPGMKNIRLRDIATPIWTTDPKDILLNSIMQDTEAITKARALVLNTFHAMEREAIEALTAMFHHVYTIGPIHLMLNRVEDQSLHSISTSLWKEDNECIKWLDSKDPESVVYVNFGSITVLTAQQMTEFAWGLANSNKTFLWIIRPDLVAGDSAMLPIEFLKETEDRSMLTSWCPQEQVLRHRAVGGFLTHCGWNSILESVVAGVPLLCWPFFAEQQTNCRYCCVEWGIGMEIDSNVKRDEVRILVKKLMDGEEGKGMKEKIRELKRKAEEATAIEGSSTRDLDNLIKDVFFFLIDVVSGNPTSPRGTQTAATTHVPVSCEPRPETVALTNIPAQERSQQN